MQEWISSPIGMHPVESGQWVLAADAYAERDRLAAALAAANGTLDRLREAVPEGWHWCADCEKMTPPDDEDPDFCGVCECENYWHCGVHVALQSILYPPETTSIRDTAAAHDHDAMPADLAQRSVDGETNYVRLNPENDHANHD